MTSHIKHFSECSRSFAMDPDVKLTPTQEFSHANREGGEREHGPENAEVEKDFNDMQCTEDMIRKFTKSQFHVKYQQ